MRLERLEISGFKSFSDRAELAFDQGVTAIVGPNGCGKSNVADAITWVLGEQSAKSLRGERMEDVIFSGSDARRPGATAEVRLRLTGLTGVAPPVGGDVDAGPVEVQRPDHTGNGNGSGHLNGGAGGNGHANGNGHGHGPAASLEALAGMFSRDVEVTRRLYRSGESEYLIDGEVCRLRDVHELLMDTGLGAKAYAIIEQGKIGMILSSRPADRRQLIEEAAGITKYKSRRRSAELKLEAAQQNLTRIDDIVFEVEQQRSALKRQAAKARRYRRLREELRRWEKVLFARRYRELAAGIQAAVSRLEDARAREAAAAAHVTAVEADLGRLRIEQAEADARATRLREDAHGRELDLNRRQQQQDFDRQQAETLGARAAEITVEIESLTARRAPALEELESRRRASGEAARAREEASAVLAAAADEHARAQQGIDGHEGDVEGARAEVFAVMNAATALRHAIDTVAGQRARVGETLGKLDLEADDLRRETEVVEREAAAASEALARAAAALEGVTLDRAARESELASARTEQDASTRALRAREQELAAQEARLASLRELVATRAEFGDAARMVLVQANGRVGQQGAVADYLDVDRRYERAVEACLGDLLQHVIVDRHDQAEAGLSLVREQDAGRCGFVVVDPGSNGFHPRESLRMPGVVPVAEVLRIAGPHVTTILKVIPEAYVAETFQQALAVARATVAPVATLDGDVLRGPHLVSGGAMAESRGILATRREIKELETRIAQDRETLARLAAEAQRLELVIAAAAGAAATLQSEQHRQDKEIVAHESRAAHTKEERARLARKSELIAFERRQAEDERGRLDAREREALASLERLQTEQGQADERLSSAQRLLASARQDVDILAGRVAESRAVHAALVERAVALQSEVERLEESARDLDQRITLHTAEEQQVTARRAELLRTIAHTERLLDDGIRALEVLRQELLVADESAAEVRGRVDRQDEVIREARHAMDVVRDEAGSLDVQRVAAESELSHLAQACRDGMQASLDDVLREVETMEASGEATPDAAAIAADEVDPEAGETEGASGEPVAVVPAPASMSADEAITALKAKIDRLGPVNMMAIEQFDELETRHTFLTTQRKDLVDSIAQTTEAITRIDETTKSRFTEAFAAIQVHFQGTFSTLFGGGRAGLSLLDENDPLESGIDIVASPPGKRLQSVQLLSGGEKALTAIALMFAIFKYKPSPFCLLDEIDAPLDDANVGRFVDMLSGMLDRTQFILITHNRRTMEIADRLYGVTMEEPGVSKLISVQLH